MSLASKLSGMVVDDKYLYTGGGFSNVVAVGFPPLDIALGGGIPLDGAIIEIAGEESHGKTTFTYRVCKKVHEKEGYVTWIDNETSYDEDWAAVNGVNPELVIPYRPPYMEKAIDIIIDDITKYKTMFLPWLVDPKWKPKSEHAEAAGVGISKVDEIKAHMEEVAPPHIIVWDTIANCPVKSLTEGAIFGGGMAERARMIKSFIQRYQVAVDGCSKLAIILINQVIENIGDQYNPLSTPGGRGLRHGKHLALYVKKAGSGEKDVHNFQSTDYVYVAVTKNKVTPVIASFPIIFSKSKGFIGATSLLEYLMNIRWFKDAGSWKKFTMETVDPDSGEVTEEEVSLQRGTFYKLVEQRPEIFYYLCDQVRLSYVEKFPFNKRLKNLDMTAIVQACLEEQSSIPEEGEESVQSNPVTSDQD